MHRAGSIAPRIREASETDLDGMLAVYRAVVARGDTLPFPESFDVDAFRADWLVDGSFVASAADGVTGMYRFGANRSGRGSHVATATYLVGPEHQGMGIGRALVADSLARAEAAGFVAMQFNYVVATNVAAIALYLSLGFVIVGTLPRAFRHAALGLVDAHVMYRFLAAPAG